jgi:hypothetical protein
MVEISGFSHFFGFRRLERRRWALAKPPNIREFNQNPVGAWQLPNLPPTKRLFCVVIGILPCCNNKKTGLHRRRGSTCLVQERKAENEECL